ncbi:FAD-dependent monooxygenase [Saccharopolyspora elongata]|uniref:Oxygenase n=1 Tax=Saccharopolyspora elongata TaxID=2530387 RepID=A0A4R4Y3I5_9PSEU|nr:FAD-dependent monooxygenase [Saccharopolyspora elongata]TDD38636.1 oxygenase [Saccharopolyspora elongata]
METTSVLVVGAGPAGLALACGLRQHGITVRVIDQAAGPASTSRANILHARGVEVLNRLGALGDLPDRALHAVRMTLHVGEKPLAEVSFGQIEGNQLSALLVSQAEVEAVLRERLGELGGTVEWGRELTDLDQRPEGVTAKLRDGGLSADYVVGCDGAHSTVRKLSGIGFPGVPLVDQWLLADVRADWVLDRTGSSGWFHRDGLFFAMPMRNGADDAWRLMADVRPGTDSGDVLDQLQKLLPERTGRTDAKIGDVAWTSAFRIHRRLADRYRDGRVLLVGDAAHIHSPFGGQGMNTGIGDAENLAWKLALVAESRADSALLDTYQAERRPLAEDVLRSTTANTKLMLADGAVARFARDRLITPLANLAMVQRRATWLASQLWVDYRKGPLGSRRGPRPRPGDRVPDLACRGDRGPTRLHSELGGKWALLAPPGTSLEVLAPLGEHVVRLAPDRPQRDVWLIRPDAHLAWRGTELRSLARWLDNALGNGRTT